MAGSHRRVDRLAVVVCDSVGCGLAPDAALFGDRGANTLGHVLEATEVELPELTRLGLGRVPGVPLPAVDEPTAAHGRMIATAPAKDTMTGHWELMGLVSDTAFPTYPDGFPDEVVEAFEQRVGRGVLGNVAASGTEIIARLGAEHVRTGSPIVYTSADSVFQIAAHEDVIPVQDLYGMCEVAREILTGDHGVGRVIARPFIGDGPGTFHRTSRRRDLALPPPGPTALDRLVEAGLTTHGVGKIHDIFAGRGLSSWEKTPDNAAGVRETCRALRKGTADLILANLVDFDSDFGHRRDPEGYAGALQAFDAAVPDLLDALEGNRLLVITADHGNDPTWRGTDHTRECVPLLVAGPGVRNAGLGTRATFADLGATVLDALGTSWDGAGTSFLSEIL